MSRRNTIVDEKIRGGGNVLCISDTITIFAASHLVMKQNNSPSPLILPLVSNFGDSGEMHERARKWVPARRSVPRRASLRDASPHGSPFSRRRVQLAGFAKIRDLSQSTVRYFIF